MREPDISIDINMSFGCRYDAIAKENPMRLQLALNVDDLDASVAFYEKMFDTTVAKRKPGYANFAIKNPPLKLVLFESPGEGGSINHLGVEVEESAQVIGAEQRLSAAGLLTTGVDDTVCCYAEKTETWVESPEGRWEWYVKTGEAETMENVVLSDDGTACCAPATDAPASQAADSCC